MLASQIIELRLDTIPPRRLRSATPRQQLCGNLAGCEALAPGSLKVRSVRDYRDTTASLFFFLFGSRRRRDSSENRLVTCLECGWMWQIKLRGADIPASDSAPVSPAPSRDVITWARLNPNTHSSDDPRASQFPVEYYCSHNCRA